MPKQATLYFNGHVLTMDEYNSVAEAVLVIADKIVAVGSRAEISEQAPERCSTIDLMGSTMMPAFIDAHGHFPDPGFISLFRVDLAAPPRGDCIDMVSALDRLRQKSLTVPHGEWVMGVLFDNTAIHEQRMPTRMELDNVSTDHPIWVLHASGHNGVANSVALALNNIDEDTPAPQDGSFGRDAETGRLNGLIEGLRAMGEMGNTNFLIDRERFWQGFDATREEYTSFGVTLAQNAWATREMLEHFESLPVDQDPGIDLVILPIGQLEPELSKNPVQPAWRDNPYFTLGPRKLFTDGAFQLQTAFLSEDYLKPTKLDAKRGAPYTTIEELTRQVKKLHNLNFQIHCHCNGDAGSDLFLDAVDTALKENPREDHRHTIIHGQVLRDDQLQRMSQLGVTVSFFSAHIHYWGDKHANTFLGSERANRISPAASAEKYGVRYTLHNDASVTPTRPLHLVHCAVNRLTASGQQLGEGEKISVQSALRAVTIDAAWQVFQEKERGSIEPGKLADLVVLSRNPLLEPAHIESTTVTSTIRRGKLVYSQP